VSLGRHEGFKEYLWEELEYIANEDKRAEVLVE
jgi:hypothetical protein